MGTHSLLRSTTALSTAALAFVSSLAHANPQGGTVVEGSASITQTDPKTLTINQKSDKAIINWRSFSIGVGETTRFNQPSSSSVVLNRVTGDQVSQILGTLSANGRVFLVNPNGILFGSGAKVDVAALVASTHDIENRNFMAGKYRFDIPGKPTAQIINQGTITASQGGLVALVAPSVRNSGLIEARLGRIAMVSANGFTIDLYGDNLILFQASDKITQQIRGQGGKLVSSLVENTGHAVADGGSILLTADAAKGVVDQAVNMQGIARARNVSEHGGEIVLDGGEGATNVAGTLDASGKDAGLKGGSVKVLGDRVALASVASVDVSGDQGGGTALVGGNFHGAGPERNATATTVENGATINADAVSKGEGGKVAVWSNQTTSYQGFISARGGSQGGDGGAVEVSGCKRLDFNGPVDLRAPKGKAGSLLLDPENVTISDSGDSPALPGSGDTTLRANADSSVLKISTLLSALGLGNVTVETGSTGNQASDITVANNITWNTGNALTLSSYRNVTVSDGVTIANTGAGNLSLRADNTGTGMGKVLFTGTGKVNYSGSTGKVTIYYAPEGAAFFIVPNYGANAITNGAVSGQLTAYRLIYDSTDLQTIGNYLSGNFALAKNINASGTLSWNGGAGFVPIGTSLNPFTGKFDGQSFTITGLTTYLPNTDYVGMFGYASGSTIKNVGLVGGAVTGRDPVGGLVGYSLNGTVSGSYNTGSVTSTQVLPPGPPSAGSISVGGLVGDNIGGTVSNSYTTGTVYAPDNDKIGGLVGYNTGTISDSHSSSNVTGRDSVGGLVGYSLNGTISNSYATGNVTSTMSGAPPAPPPPGPSIGGFIGDNVGGTITQSYSTGNVSAPTNNDIGGFAGYNSGNISKSYSTGSVTGQSNVGGFVGWNNGGSVSDSYAKGGAVYGSGDSIGGFVGKNASGLFWRSYAAGPVTYGGSATNVGGFAGSSVGNFPSTETINRFCLLSGCYYDSQATLQGSTSALGTPQTTSQLTSGTLPSGFSSSVWTATAGQYPKLAWQTSSGISTTSTTKTFGAGASSTSASNSTASSPAAQTALDQVLHPQSPSILKTIDTAKTDLSILTNALGPSAPLIQVTPLSGSTPQATVPTGLAAIPPPPIASNPKLQTLVNEIWQAYGGNADTIKTVADNAKYAQLANAAYLDSSSIKLADNWQLANGPGATVNLDNNTWAKVLGADIGATTFHQKDTNNIVISFRGTANLSNVVSDVLPTAWNNLASVAMEYVNTVRKNNPDANIIFTGHSLGGSLAEYAALKTGGTAVAFDSAPLGYYLNPIDAASLPSSLSKASITNFRGPNDPVSGATALLQVGNTIDVRNAPVFNQGTDLAAGGSNLFVSGGGGFNNHSMELLTNSMLATKHIAPMISSTTQ